MDKEIITLAHGNGGRLTQKLIKEKFVSGFSNEYLNKMTDSALVSINGTKLAFTTDSYVIKPHFFPGGDIGKLAVCGTINDLAVMGAEPKYISCGFIIEEGFSLEDLSKIIDSMKDQAQKSGVKIVTGDTKVVDKGSADKIFINTSGVGQIKYNISENTIKAGDKLIVNGTLADHGIAVYSAREKLNIKSNITSDSAPLSGLILSVLEKYPNVKFMRDITRGGLATVLNEVCNEENFGVEVYEDKIPVKEEVKAVCELLGFDPLYIANEGKVLFIVPRDDAENILALMKKHEYGKDARIIGEVVSSYPGKAYMRTSIGGKRIIDMLTSDQLPRIC
ncbi:MAG: hydrogenase expression/formation protein HypE [Armatimonadota bacterium]